MILRAPADDRRCVGEDRGERREERGEKESGEKERGVKMTSAK